MPLKNRIIFKILILIVLIITLFSTLAIYYMRQNNLQVAHQLIANQKEYITHHLEKDKQQLIQKELEYVQEHALSIVDSVKNALLYNISKDIIKETLIVFMRQKTIKAVYIYDDITNDTYIGIMKNNHKIITMENDFLKKDSLKMLKYPIEIDGNNFGYVSIYYNIIPLINKINIELETRKKSDYLLLEQQSSILETNIKTYLIDNFIIFIFYIFIILLSITYIFTKYIHQPLYILQENLHNFFTFFKDSKKKIILQHIPLQDEFGQMSREINENIQTVLTLHHELNTTQKEIFITMGTIADKHSMETSNHVKRVACYSKILAKYLGFNKEEINILKDASAMHDIGKIAIPDYILNKQGALTNEEYLIMKEHPSHGFNMLKHSQRPLLKAAATIAYEHHEKYDGTGYPRKLKGTKIHIYGRIVALSDVFDALSSRRIYKDTWNDTKIFNYLKKERGKHFDPELIDIFFKHFDEFNKIRAQFKDKV